VNDFNVRHQPHNNNNKCEVHGVSQVINILKQKVSGQDQVTASHLCELSGLITSQVKFIFQVKTMLIISTSVFY